MPMRSCSIGRSSLAVPLALLVVSICPGVATQAAGDCAAAPNATAPQGSHWYYRLDRTTKRKCWYIAAQGNAAIRVVARAKASVKARKAAIKASKSAAVERPTRPAAAAPRSLAPNGDATATATIVSPNATIVSPNKVQELIYGTEPTIEAAARARADALPQESKAAEMNDNVLQTVNVTSPARHDEARDETDAFAVIPPTRAIAALVITRPAASAAAAATEQLAQMILLGIIALATAGSALYACVRIAVARRRRVRVERRRAYPFGQPLLSYEPSSADELAAAAAKTGRYAA